MPFSTHLSRFFGKPLVVGDDVHRPAHSTFDSGAQAAAWHGNDAIYDLLGTSSDASRDPAGHLQDEVPATAGPDDVIRRLNDQYYQAIASPHASMAGEWVGSGFPVEHGSARQGWEVNGGLDDATGSIVDLLSDIEALDEAFGPLRHGEAPEPAMPEPMPEILQLFAPPEFHATVSRRAASLPPSLARREHHTLAIDSPLVARDAASLAPQEATR